MVLLEEKKRFRDLIFAARNREINIKELRGLIRKELACYLVVSPIPQSLHENLPSSGWYLPNPHGRQRSTILSKYWPTGQRSEKEDSVFRNKLYFFLPIIFLTFACINCGGGKDFRDSLLALEFGALLALELSLVLVVGADGAGLAGAGLDGEQGSLGAGYCRNEKEVSLRQYVFFPPSISISLTAIILNGNISVITSELLGDLEAALLNVDIGEGVVHVQFVLFKNDLFNQPLNAFLKWRKK